MGMLTQETVLSSFSNGSVTSFVIIITSLANILVLNHFLNKETFRWLQRDLRISEIDFGTSILLSNRPYRL